MLPRTPQKVIENASLTRYTSSSLRTPVLAESLVLVLVALATKGNGRIDQ
jgi:hypothetical protein